MSSRADLVKKWLGKSGIAPACTSHASHTAGPSCRLTAGYTGQPAQELQRQTTSALGFDIGAQSETDSSSNSDLEGMYAFNTAVETATLPAIEVPESVPTSSLKTASVASHRRCEDAAAPLAAVPDQPLVIPARHTDCPEPGACQPGTREPELAHAAMRPRDRALPVKSDRAWVDGLAERTGEEAGQQSWSSRRQEAKQANWARWPRRL